MTDDVAKLKRRIQDLEDVVGLLVERVGAQTEVADLEAHRDAERATRTAERNEALSQSTRAAGIVNRRPSR